MEAIWTVVYGNLMLARNFSTSNLNPTLDSMRQTLRLYGCHKTADVPDFDIDIFCSEDYYPLWHGESRVRLSEVENYDYPELAKALVKAAGHSYHIYMCLSRGPDPERENLSTFASFLLAYQPKIQRPLHAEWTYAWEVTTGAMTRITYGEVCKLHETLKNMKILHL